MSLHERFKNEIDWDRFVVGFFFGYAMSMLPIVLNYVDSVVVPGGANDIPVYLSSDTYIVFSVLALASIGGVLANANKRGVVEFVIVGLSIIFGFFMYHFSKILDLVEQGSRADLLAMSRFMENFFFASLFLSVAFFAASNISSRKVANGNRS